MKSVLVFEDSQPLFLLWDLLQIQGAIYFGHVWLNNKTILIQFEEYWCSLGGNNVNDNCRQKANTDQKLIQFYKKARPDLALFIVTYRYNMNLSGTYVATYVAGSGRF